MSLPETWTAAGLAADFASVHNIMENRSFAFVLGAGASVTSGIPTGGQLARKWVAELHTYLCHGDVPLETWATSEVLEIPEFEFSRVAEYYPQVFLRRFRADPDLGYAYLEREMERAEPSYGYSVLAQILSDTRHRVVITTNFDNLVADAISIYGSSYPLIAGHESLTGFVRGRLRRPLVAKIHRDLFLEPVNDPEGVGTLPEVWRQALIRLLREYTPIFVGYGGNDGSLMGLLESLSPADVAGRIRWCYREADGTPSTRVLVLVEKLNGVLVPIDGFDELMLLIGNRLEFGLRDEYVRSRGVERADILRAQYERLIKAVEEPAKSGRRSASASDAERALDETLRRRASPLSYVLRLGMESGPESRIALAYDAVDAFPNDGDVLSMAAFVLTDAPAEADRKHAVELAKKALEVIDPSRHVVRGGLLKEVLGDLEAADSEYGKAIEATPDDPTIYHERAELWLMQGDARLARAYLTEARNLIDQVGDDDQDQHARLLLINAALNIVASLLVGQSPSDDDYSKAISVLESGVQAHDYIILALLNSLRLTLNPERYQYAETLLQCMTGSLPPEALRELRPPQPAEST
jgi:tetratricopeptide (TPR) repeat protein